MSQPVLSICIPTYNRSGPLDECLGSLSSIASCYLQQLEIVISDNASTDTTREIVEKYQESLGLRYFRNSENIGPDRNIETVTRLGTADYLWIFGDDDVLEEAAVANALQHIQMGYDLIFLNCSIWSSDMRTMRRPRAISRKHVRVYETPDQVMDSLGPHLGYISSVIARKTILTAAPLAESEPFLQYGFAHLYSTYFGLLPICKAIYLPDPVFKNRGDNSPSFWGEDGFTKWLNFFIYGTAYVFDTLESKGYSRWAVVSAKNLVLRDFAVNAILARMPKIHRRVVLRKMISLYRWNWRFWAICLPGLLIPFFLLDSARRTYRNAHRVIQRMVPHE